VEVGHATVFHTYHGDAGPRVRSWVHDECWDALIRAGMIDLDAVFLAGAYERGSTRVRADSKPAYKALGRHRSSQGTTPR